MMNQEQLKRIIETQGKWWIKNHSITDYLSMTYGLVYFWIRKCFCIENIMISLNSYISLVIPWKMWSKYLASNSFCTQFNIDNNIFYFLFLKEDESKISYKSF